jgi:hypothetical protein
MMDFALKFKEIQRFSPIFGFGKTVVRNCTKLCEVVRNCAKLYGLSENCTNVYELYDPYKLCELFVFNPLRAMLKEFPATRSANTKTPHSSPKRSPAGRIYPRHNPGTDLYAWLC